MKKGTMLFLLVLVVLAFASVPKMPIHSGRVSVTPSENVNGILINELSAAKRSGDIMGARAIQGRIDELTGVFSPVLSVSSDSRIGFVRRSSSERSEKGFSTDIGVASTIYKEEYPVIAGSSDGTLYCAFEANDPSVHSYTYIAVKRSTDNGDTWNDFFTITNPSTALRKPSIVVGEGEQNWIFIAYHKDSPAYVEVARVAPSGAGGEIHTVETPSLTSCVNARIAVDGDSYYYVYIAYIRSNLLDTDVHFARSTDFGVSWSVSDITSDGREQCDIACGGAGNIYVVAQTGNNDATSQIYLSLSTDYGYSFSSESYITETNKDNFPRIAAEWGSDTAVITYTYAYSTSDHDIYYSYTTDGGINWTTSLAVAASFRNERYSDIASIGAGFSIAFYEQGKVRLSSCSNIFAGFGTADDISDEATAVEYFPAITKSYETPFGCPAVVWTKRYSESDNDILFDRDCCSELSAHISASAGDGVAPLTVSFSDSSSGVVELREWRVGGTLVSTAASFDTTFSIPGTYIIQLAVRNWCSLDEAYDTITVTCPPLSADFAAVPEAGMAPLTVQFVDSSTGSISEWMWDFGSDGTSATENPVHTFDDAGTYNVRLVISDECGDKDTTYRSVTVFPPTAPEIAYNPSSLDFGTQNTSSCGELWLVVSNSGGTALTIDSSLIAPSVYTLETSLPLSVPPLGTDSILVRFCPAETLFYDGVLQIWTNDPENSVVRIALTGTGSLGATPGLTFSPEAVDFDSVAQYDNVSQRITVRNISTDTIHVNSMYLSGSGAFTIAGRDTFSIAPDRYKYITINFEPHGIGAYAGTLQVSTDVGTKTIPISGISFSSMSCVSYGSYTICSSHIDGDRAYGNIAFLNAEGDTILTLVSLGDIGAYVDMSIGAGTGRGVFHYADGSTSTIFVGAFDLTYYGLYTHFSGSTDMLPDTIRDLICPDSLLGMPFQYTAGIDPVRVDIDDGWWKLQGSLSLSNGSRVVAYLNVSRQRYRDGSTDWNIEDFDISLFDDVFRFGFSDISVGGDTISAGRITVEVSSSLLPSTTFIDRGSFEINARSLMIVDGHLENLDLDMQFPDFVIPAGASYVALRNPRLRLVWEDGEIVRISGGARFETTGLSASWGSRAYISAYVTILRYDGVDDVALAFSGWSPGIPLGSTGFFLTGVSGEVRHLSDPSNLYVSFGCEMRGGPSVPVLGSIVELDPTISIDFGEGEFDLDGAIRFLEHLARGHAGLTYKTHDVGGGWGIEGYANLHAGISSRIYIEGGTDLHLWRDTAGGFHLVGDGYVEGHLQHRAIFWFAPTHDITVEAHAWFGEFKHGGDSGGHWGVKGQLDIELFGLRPAFSYIDGHLSTMEDAWAYTPADELRFFYAKGTMVREEIPYDISNTDMNVFIVRTDADIEPTLTLSLPDGRTYTPDSCSTSDESAVRYFTSQVGDDGYRYTGYVIHERHEGRWTAYIDSLPAGDSDHPMQVRGFYNPLALDLSVAPTADGFSLTGSVAGAEAGDSVWLDVYLRSVGSDGGDYLVEQLLLTDPFNVNITKTFSEIGAKGGNYTLHAFAEDARNRIAFFDDSTTVLTAPTDATPPSAPTTLIATWTDTTVRVLWQPSTSPDVAGYKLYKGFDRDGDIWWWENVDIGDAKSALIVNTDVMVPDTCEFVVGVSAYDASGNESEITTVSPAGRDPADRDVIPPSVAIESVEKNLDERTATLHFSSADTDLAGYILLVGTVSDEYSQEFHIAGDATSYTMTKLQVGATYYLRLVAYDDYLNQSEPVVTSMDFFDAADADGDGLPDWWENFYFGNTADYGPADDPDSDLVSNINEYLAGTNPNNEDTDGDRVPDLSEIASSLLDPNSDEDADGDRLPDDWEIYFFGSDTITGLDTMDPDSDMLTNAQEFEHSTNPHEWDTDDGGVPDGFEVMFDNNPLDPSDDDDIHFTLYLQRGWNLVSVPVRSLDSSAAAIIPSALAVYRYNTETGLYESAENISPGEGYFVLVSADTSVDLVGLPLWSTEKELHRGWNLIGAPMSINGISVAALYTDPEDIILYGSIYAYSGFEYVASDAIVAGYGYWLLTSGDGDLTVGDGGLHKRIVSDDVIEECGSYPPPPPDITSSLPIPSTIELLGARPNPFNSQTSIEFALPNDATVSLSIYDVTGRTVKTIASDSKLSTGYHRLLWNGTNDRGTTMPSGIYLYLLRANETTFDGKLLLTR